MRTLFLVLFSASLFAQAQPKNPYLIVGTYTEKGSEGIYVYRFDSKTGALTPTSITKGIQNPSFVTTSPDGKYVFVAEETDKGAVKAYSFDQTTGSLTELNTQPSGGAYPCYLTADATGKWLMVGNYGGGNFRIFPIEANGALGAPAQTIQHEGHGPNTDRQEAPHVHSVNLSANNRDLFVADLGTDKLMAYSLDPATGKITAGNPPFMATAPGSGPRHFAFHPNGKFAYAILELNATIEAFDYQNGALKEIQTVPTLPKSYEGANKCADIHISPDGKFLYGSNRGHNSLVIYKIDPSTGRLTFVGDQSVMGATPRNFAIDPSGKFILVANQDSDNIQVFKRNKKTGLLTYTGQETKVSMPVCLKFR